MTCHKDSKTAEDGAPRPSPLGVAETGLCFASGTATPDWWRMEKSKLLDKKAVESEFRIASAAHDLIIFDADLQMSRWKIKLHITTRIQPHISRSNRNEKRQWRRR